MRRILPSDDIDYERVITPFPITFWGATIPEGSPVLVNVDGYLTLQDIASYGRPLIPSTLHPNAFIAAFADDLGTRATGICLLVRGVAPRRQWVIQWDDAYTRGHPTDSLTFQIGLDEGDPNIYVRAGVMRASVPGVLGVENPTGTQAVGGCSGGGFSCFLSGAGAVTYVPR